VFLECELMPNNKSQGSQAETSPQSNEIHRVIREEGEKDLNRHTGATAWSGLAAGLSMGFSFLTMAVLQAGLPDRPWRNLVSGFGYTLGFLIVVLGKQQLFTESTLTAVLPMLAGRSWCGIPKLLLYWLVVLVTNLAGTVLFAWLICHQALFQPEVWTALGNIADEAMHDPFWPMLIKAVLASWLIALMIWLLPGSGPARMLIIIVLTYVVAISHFSHSIAGSVESAFGVFAGHIAPLD
jgi:formate-nitrite transporter family protein